LSLDELKQKAKGERLDLEKAEEGTYRAISWRFQRDRTGKECLYIDYRNPEGYIVTQKYTPGMIAKFVEYLEKIGIIHLNDLIGKDFHYEFEQLQRLGNPRLVPTKKTKAK